MITQMSRAWLGAIKQSEIEYPFAVEQLIINEENDGYDLVYQSKEKNAIQMFYYLIRKDDFYSGWAGVSDLAYKNEALNLKFAQKKIGTLKKKSDGRRYGRNSYGCIF